MNSRTRPPLWKGLGGIAIVITMMLAFAGIAAAANTKPRPVGVAQVRVVTLTASPVVVTTPGQVYDVTFTPESAASFTQQPGEVVTVSMAADFSVPNGEHLFCDVHAATDLTDGESDSMYTAMQQTFITQRGDVWWAMNEQGRDLTRTVPGPVSATDHSVIGVVWMDEPAEGADNDCYGTEYGFEHQDVTVDIQVSVVTVQQ